MNQAESAAAEPDYVLRQLGSSPAGLSPDEARRRLRDQGPNAVGGQGRSLGKIVAEQARNGINLMLTGAGVLTIVTGDAVDGSIIVIADMLHHQFRRTRAVARVGRATVLRETGA